MTAPKRQNGRLVEHVVRGCASKNRYSDEFAARGIGQAQQANTGIKLYVYRCDICRGWHLTKNKQRDAWRSVDWDFNTKGEART